MRYYYTTHREYMALARVSIHGRRKRGPDAGAFCRYLPRLRRRIREFIAAVSRADAGADDRSEPIPTYSERIRRRRIPFGITLCPSIPRSVLAAVTFGASHQLPSTILPWRLLHCAILFRCFTQCEFFKNFFNSFCEILSDKRRRPSTLLFSYQMNSEKSLA